VHWRESLLILVMTMSGYWCECTYVIMMIYGDECAPYSCVLACSRMHCMSVPQLSSLFAVDHSEGGMFICRLVGR